MLIAGRALQGVAGGGLLQLVTIIISDLFSVRYGTLIIYRMILALYACYRGDLLTVATDTAVYTSA